MHCKSFNCAPRSRRRRRWHLPPAATEGAQHANFPGLPGPNSRDGDRPFSILESANRLAREQVEAYNAKLTVFQAFCVSFEETAQRFTSGLERSFAQHFSQSFLEFRAPSHWALDLGHEQRSPTPTSTTNSPASPATTGSSRPTSRRPPRLHPA